MDVVEDELVCLLRCFDKFSIDRRAGEVLSENGQSRDHVKCVNLKSISNSLSLLARSGLGCKDTTE